VGYNASGFFKFGGNPGPYGDPLPTEFYGSINICGTTIYFVNTPDNQNYIEVPIGPTIFGTLSNLLNTLITSYDPNLDLCVYSIDETGTKLIVTAQAQGPAGNRYPISQAAWGIAASGPYLTGGSGLGNFFINGQIIFRSGLLINDAYEIQASEGSTISLFTPLEFSPQPGDQIDIIQGCDHSPFAGGCLQYKNPVTGAAPNILNYRGEPYCFGPAYDSIAFIPPSTGTGPSSGQGVHTNTPGNPINVNPQGLWASYMTVKGSN
jgi:hypothetical protein